MDSVLQQLDYILNIEKFQKIQDDIATATDMSVITIDYKGHPVTKHSCCSDFCKTVRNDPKLGKLCEKCDSRGGLEAARDQKPYIYLCHIGVVDFAIPILVDGQYLGAVMAGQVRLNDITKNQYLEQIVSKKSQTNIDEYPHLKEQYEKLHIMTLDKIEVVAHMIHHLVNYIVGEAVFKTSLYESNQKLTELTKEHKTHLYYTENTNKKSTITETRKHSLLKPAINYIEEHFKDKIYLEKMAYLCNISPSYFSKIFKRELGENFSNYVNIIKIKNAKEMLENSDEPIINISLDLGFDDCGYFIKVFKKHIGETPAIYRSNFIQLNK